MASFATFGDAKEFQREDQIPDFLKKDFRWEPTPDEASILVQIEEQAEKLCDDLFGDATDAVQKLFDSITYYDEETKEKHEDWSQLSGQDVDAAIFSIQAVIAAVGDKVSNLYMKAQFSYLCHDEDYWDAYRKPIEGTIQDRIARARRDTRQQRFFYFFQYSVWQIVNTKLEHIKNTKKDLELLLQRRIAFGAKQIYD